MARKDLGSLAALAGLAYMASRGKGNEGETPTSLAAPTAPAPQVASQVAPQIEDESDRGTMTPEQLEYNKQIATPASRPRPALKPAAKPMGGSGRGGQGGATAEELAAYLANKPKKLQYQSLQDRARMYEEERAKSGAGGMYGSTSKRREPLPTAEDAAYKKGGKVKKMASGGGVKGWGIARGSRKAKTY